MVITTIQERDSCYIFQYNVSRYNSELTVNLAFIPMFRGTTSRSTFFRNGVLIEMKKDYFGVRIILIRIIQIIKNQPYEKPTIT